MAISSRCFAFIVVCFVPAAIMAVDGAGSHAVFMLLILMSGVIGTFVLLCCVGGTMTHASRHLMKAPPPPSELLERARVAFVVGLPVTTCSSEELAQCDCALCLQDYRCGEQIRTLPCSHHFHKCCIDRWFSSSAMINQPRRCPICRTNTCPNPLNLASIAMTEQADATDALAGAGAVPATAITADTEIQIVIAEVELQAVPAEVQAIVGSM